MDTAAVSIKERSSLLSLSTGDDRSPFSAVFPLPAACLNHQALNDNPFNELNHKLGPCICLAQPGAGLLNHSEPASSWRLLAARWQCVHMGGRHYAVNAYSLSAHLASSSAGPQDTNKADGKRRCGAFHTCPSSTTQITSKQRSTYCIDRCTVQVVSQWSGRGPARAASPTCCTSPLQRARATPMHVSTMRRLAERSSPWQLWRRCYLPAAVPPRASVSPVAGHARNEQQEQPHASSSDRDRTGTWNGPAPRGYVSEPMHVGALLACLNTSGLPPLRCPLLHDETAPASKDKDSNLSKNSVHKSSAGSLVCRRLKTSRPRPPASL
jgi:hypothetical protein